MRNKLALIFVFCLLLLGWSNLYGQDKDITESIKIDVKEYTLKNGMKVLILERFNSPTIATYIYFRVGSVREQNGQTGISHLLEHLLFKGSQTIGTTDYQSEKVLLEKQDELMEKIDALERQEKALGKNPDENPDIKALIEEVMTLNKELQSYSIPREFSEIYTKNGAQDLNAATSWYETYYYEKLPANKLELWAWLESDHLSNPVLRGFYEEKYTVLEERRTRSEDNPNGLLWEEFCATMFKAHPYHKPIIGWRTDVESLKRSQVEQYFKSYYTPNNAVAVIVGAVKADDVMALMRKYFEPIPAGTPVPPIITKEPEQFGEKRVTVEFDAQPVMIIGYKGTTIGTKDDYTFDLISTILGHGRLSRLYKKLVLDKKMCLEIGTGNMAYPDIGIFQYYAIPQAPYTAEQVEQAIYDEIEVLKNELVSEKETQRAKNLLQVSFLRGLNSNDGMAERLGSNEITSSWRYLIDWLPNCQKITAEDIRNAANKYFVPERRTVATLVTRKPAKKETSEKSE